MTEQPEQKPCPLCAGTGKIVQREPALSPGGASTYVVGSFDLNLISPIYGT